MLGSPVVEDLDEADVGQQIVPAATSSALTVPSAQPAEQRSALLFNHDTVMRAAGYVAPAAAAAGGTIAHLLTPIVAQNAADAVRDAVRAEGDRIAAQVLDQTGLGRVPGGALLLSNQSAQIAHQAGEMAYQAVSTEMPARGAAFGGLIGAFITIASMEFTNLTYWAYQRYVRSRAAASQTVPQIEAAPLVEPAVTETIDDMEFTVIRPD